MGKNCCSQTIVNPVRFLYWHFFWMHYLWLNAFCKWDCLEIYPFTAFNSATYANSVWCLFVVDFLFLFFCFVFCFFVCLFLFFLIKFPFLHSILVLREFCVNHSTYMSLSNHELTIPKKVKTSRYPSSHRCQVETRNPNFQTVQNV